MAQVVAVQLRVDDSEPQAVRFDRLCRQIADLAPIADLVVLPELWSVGAFNTSAMMAAAEPMDGLFVTRMAQAAADAGVWLHAGSFPELHPEGVSNTSVLFDDTGQVRARYRKIHLFGFDEGEAVTVAGGTEVVVTESPFGMLGLATCYDLRFPELFRALQQLGAQVLLVPAGWPQARLSHWSVLLSARAIENQCVVVGCNAVGTNGGVQMGGGSLIIGPDGTVWADALGGNSLQAETTVAADIDLNTVSHYRQNFPVLRDRRL